MIAPSTPPPEPPLDPPAYVQQVQDNPYERFNNAVIENPKPSLDTECREAEPWADLAHGLMGNPELSPDIEGGEAKPWADLGENLRDSAEAWSEDKQKRDNQKMEDDIALGSRKNEESAAMGPPGPPDACRVRMNNSDLANSLADADGISLAPEVGNDYRVNTSPWADLAQDLSDKPDQFTKPVEDIQETLES
jgi:hypothetical protein